MDLGGKPSGPVDWEQLAPWLQDLTALFTEAHKKDRARIAELESRLKTIEEHGVRYCGAYQRSLAGLYRKGSIVSHHGSAWVAIQDQTNSEPGTDATWQLMVKRGRDASKADRDAATEARGPR